MAEQPHPRAAWLDVPVVSKPSIAHKVSSIFARDRSGLHPKFVFPLRRIRLVVVNMPVHLLWHRLIFIVLCMVGAVFRIYFRMLILRHEAGVVVYHFVYKLHIRYIVVIVRINSCGNLRYT